jgi:hypothetical protein
MITNDGKDIIGKFILGQIPSFATHIAVGCGAKPITTTDSMPDTTILESKKKLDFEMTRAPIISKGFVDQTYQYAITAKSLTNDIATLTIGSHVLQVGDSVSVDLDEADSAFDGTHRITSISSTTISFASDNIDVSPVSKTGTLIGSKTKISLTAALPSDNKYEITEVGLWSASNNILAVGQDSRLLFSFQDSWEAHASSIITPIFKNNIGTTDGINYASTPERIFYASTSNVSLHGANRRLRKEGPRLGNNTILIRGDSSKISGTSGNWTESEISYDISFVSLTDNVAKIETSIVSSINVGDSVTIVGITGATSLNGIFNVTSVDIATKSFSFSLNNANITRVAKTGTATIKSSHIHLNNVNFNIGQNSASDILSLSLSVIDKDSVGNGTPDSVKILMEFYRNEISTTSGYAKKEITIDSASLGSSRHQVVSFPISSLITSTDFSSSEVTICRIFSSVIYSGIPSSNHFVCFDGMRLDNITTENPVYKMSAYSIVQNANGYPIVKLSNSNNYIEFRLTLGIS